MRWIKPPLTALDKNMAVWGATFSASCLRKRWGRNLAVVILANLVYLSLRDAKPMDLIFQHESSACYFKQLNYFLVSYGCNL